MFRIYQELDGVKSYITHVWHDEAVQFSGPDAELQAASTNDREKAEALPGVYYMDPPDGGDVPLTEQVLRMAKDAARYRKWRHGATARCVETAKALCYASTPEQIDEAIDTLHWEG